MKTIIYVGGFELPDKNAAAHRVLSNAKIFKALGYKIILVGLDKSLNFSNGLVRTATDWDGFECYSLAYPKSHKEWFRQLLGRKELFSFFKKAKGLHAVIYYNYPSIALIRFIKLMKKIKVKNVVDITEWHSSKGMNPLIGIVKYFDAAIRIKLVPKICNGIITTSKYLTETYQNKGLLTLELPTLFDTLKFVKPKNNKHKNETMFLFVGSPFYELKRAIKNKSCVKERLDKIIHAFFEMEFNRYIFQIVGVTKEEYLKVYPKDSVILEKLEQNIKFLGRLPNNKVKNLLCHSDFTIFFRDENKVTLAGFPSKLAESISAGIPVITNRMKSIEPYLSNQAIFCAKSNEERQLIEECIKFDDEMIETLKATAYNSKTFDYKTYLKSTEDFLQRV